MPDAGSQQIPECRKQDRPNECFEERYPEEDEITRNDEGYHTRDDPYPYQCGNDRADDAQGGSPAYNELCYKTDNDCDKQVQNLTQIKNQMHVPQIDREEWSLTQDTEHKTLLLVSMSVSSGRKGTPFRYKPNLLSF